MNLPWDYNNEIHDVPWISKVASFVKNESISQDFDHHFYCKDGHEHRFQLFL